MSPPAFGLALSRTTTTHGLLTMVGMSEFDCLGLTHRATLKLVSITQHMIAQSAHS